VLVTHLEIINKNIELSSFYLFMSIYYEAFSLPLVFDFHLLDFSIFELVFCCTQRLGGLYMGLPFIVAAAMLPLVFGTVEISRLFVGNIL
jgi:hypothetical protein